MMRYLQKCSQAHYVYIHINDTIWWTLRMCSLNTFLLGRVLASILHTISSSRQNSCIKNLCQQPNHTNWTFSVVSINPRSVGSSDHPPCPSLSRYKPNTRSRQRHIASAALPPGLDEYCPFFLSDAKCICGKNNTNNEYMWWMNDQEIAVACL